MGQRERQLWAEGQARHEFERELLLKEAGNMAWLLLMGKIQ